ncbi:MAG: HAMP domain-containing protein [Desulfobacteraceae bacterium]|nr:HAMP domain-containing protein [Desulfobacteraceae bacterium]
MSNLRKEIENSEQQIQHEIHRMIRKSLFASLIFVGIGFVIVLIVSMRFSKPLIQLAQAARNLSKSNFSDASDIPQIHSIAKDELGILADAFGLMSREIRELLRETRNYSEHLEELVGERTADLAAANEQLQHAKELAEAANKSKSHFLANMSHELRTPLNAILGFSQLMLRDKHLMPDYRENLETIVRSGEHLLTMINQVLDLSKIEAGRMTLHEKAFDFHRMLDDLEDMFALKTQEKKLRLIFERSPDVPQYIGTDELRLRQILINLLSNSVKFTKEGGIAMRVISEPSSAQKTRLHFEIEDTGVGMDEQDIHTIFDAFVQSESGKMAGEGTGLGLAISHQFVKLMGGDMTVNSKKKLRVRCSDLP